MNLPGVAFHADHEWIKNEVAEAQPFISKNRPLKRLMSILEKGSATKAGDRSWSLKFLRSPVEILPKDSQVDGIRYEINRLEGPFDQRKAIGTGAFEDQPCGLVLRSIGYRSISMPGVPFDDRQGRVPNYLGKVLTNDNQEVCKVAKVLMAKVINIAIG